MTTAADSTALASIDLSDADRFRDGPPWELFDRMRECAPVHWNAMPDASGFWSLTRYKDIRRVSRDFESFSSARGGVFLRDDEIVPWEIGQYAMINMDPPRHTKLRGIVQTVFTPRAVREMEAQSRTLTTELIDRFIERGECDFVTEFAKDMPLTVICEMGGVPRDDQAQIVQWTDRLSGSDDPRIAGSADDALAALTAIGQYLTALVAERRARPRADLISRLIEAEVDGERLTDVEVTLFFAFLMDAGNQTTRNTAAGGLLALIEHPDERRKLQHDPTLIPSAVEEILRWNSTVLHMRRTATRASEVSGVRIEEGQKVVMWYAAGNRDPAVFDNPHHFDVTRSNSADHQTFGAGGRHFCLGNQLARLNLRVIFEEVLGRMPSPELSGPITRLRSNLFQGFLGMPVSFTPGRPQGRG